RLIVCHQVLDIIGFSCMHKTIDAIPSWVPDWTYIWLAKPVCKIQEQADGSFSRTYSANKNLLEAPVFTNFNNVLRVKGFVFDSVSTVSDYRQITEQDAAKNWKQMALAQGPQYVCGGTSLEAFKRVLCADTQDADEENFQR